MVETVEHFGVKLRLDPSYMSDHMMDVIRQKKYETTEAKQIDRIVQNDEVPLYVGLKFFHHFVMKPPY